jgi:hypothetical protein
MKKFHTILLENTNWDITFGEEIQINDFQFRLPVIVNGREMSVEDINFIIEPHTVSGETLYQPHIFIEEKLQHQGIGYGIYNKFIHEFGNIYSSHWCRTNNAEIISIFNRLSKEPDITVEKNSKYYLAYLKNQE